MPLRTQNIVIPLGGGLDQSQDEWRLQPPQASTARNAVTRRKGSYQKAPGWTSRGASGVGNDRAKLLVPHRDTQLLALGQGDNAVYDETAAGWNSYGPGYVGPTHVEAVPLLSPRGMIQDVNVAYHDDGYTAVIYREVESVVNAGSSALFSPGRSVGVVFNAQYEIVAGPYEFDDMPYFPRVECITDAGGDPVFIFFGLEPQTTGNVITGMTTFRLYFGRCDMGSPPASITPSLLATGSIPNAGPGNGGIGWYSLYDTHSNSDHDNAFLVYWDGNAVVAIAVGESGTASQTVKSGTPGHLAIFHEDVSQTLLVYEAGTWDSVFYCPEIIGAFTEVTGFGSHSTAVLWRDNTGTMYVSGEEIILTGTNPGVVTIGTTDYVMPDDRELFADPQPWPGASSPLLFMHREGGQQGGIALGASGAGGTTDPEFQTAWAEGTHIIAATYHSDDEWYPRAPVLQSRFPSRIYDGAVYPTWVSARADDELPAWDPLYCSRIQTARDSSGRVLLGTAVHTPVFGGYGIVYPVGGFYPARLDPGENSGEGAPFNHDRQIYLLRVSNQQAEVGRTIVDAQGTTVIADGNVSMWDGRTWFEAPNPPRVGGYNDTASSGTGIDRSLTDELKDYPTYVKVPLRWAMKAVLIYTDANGIEWRSAPSPACPIGGMGGLTSDPLPRVTLFLDETHRRVIAQGQSFDVELYVTQRDAGYSTVLTGPGDWASLTGYFLLQRSPLLESGGSYWVPDFMRLAYSGDTPERPATPLYTDSGELAPVRPPASTVMARAGNYLFLVPSEFPYEYWPSKPLVRGRGVEWAPELILNAPTESGGIVSIAGMGDRLLLLCKNGVYEQFVGSGPDATGAGSFSPLRLVQRGDGCTTHLGTVSTPAGVFYLSKAGIRLIGQGGGGVQDVGANVADLVADTASFRSALYRDETQEVWFTDDAGLSLVLNLDSGAWTTVQRLNINNSVDSCVYKDAIHTISSTATVTYEDDTTPSTPSAGDYRMTISTPWLTFNQALSWFRCRRVRALLRVDSGSSGKLQMQIAYDYDDAVVDSFVWPYATWSALDRQVQLLGRPSRQKFDAIKITIHDATGLGEQGTSSDLLWTLVALELEVASKTGGVKLEAGAKS